MRLGQHPEFLFYCGFGVRFPPVGRRNITKDFLVAQALKGWRRHQVVEKNWRRPVSFAILHDLGNVLGKICRSLFEERLFRLEFSFEFFGALRVGELVSPSTVRAGGLHDEDVNLFPDRVEFRLRRSKMDQVERGCVVVLFAVSGSLVCPLSCLT